MPTLWCPQCRDEYREGFSACADCGVPLVAVRPTEPVASAPVTAPTRPLGPGDDPVELANVSAVEAEMIAAQIRGVGMRADVIGVGTAGQVPAIQVTQGVRALGGRFDLAAAQAVLADLAETGDAAAPLADT